MVVEREGSGWREEEGIVEVDGMLCWLVNGVAWRGWLSKLNRVSCMSFLSHYLSTGRRFSSFFPRLCTLDTHTYTYSTSLLKAVKES